MIKESKKLLIREIYHYFLRRMALIPESVWMKELGLLEYNKTLAKRLGIK